MTPHSDATSDDKQSIDRIVQSFFGLFSNRGGARPNLRAIFGLCIPQAIISKCVTPTPEVFTLEEFTRPREALLSNGTLTDFQESETSERTTILGNVAQRVCTYSKSGVLSSPMSTVAVSIRLPPRAARAARKRSSERPAITTSAPSRASFLATARPIPDPPPITTTRSFAFTLFLHSDQQLPQQLSQSPLLLFRQVSQHLSLTFHVRSNRPVDEHLALVRELDQRAATVARVGVSAHQPGLLEDVDPIGHCARCQHQIPVKTRWRHAEGRA